MPDALVSESFQKQYDDIARRVLGPTGDANYKNNYRPLPNRDIYVLISGVYEPENGYQENEDLRLIGREVKFKSDGDNEQARYNFDPAQTTNTEFIVNTGKTVDVLNVDFDRNDPTAVEETYAGNIYRVSMTYHFIDPEDGDPEGTLPTRESKWIAHVGGAVSSSSEIYDFVITESFEGEPDRYIGQVYSNYEGRDYLNGQGGSPSSGKTMLIENALGNPLSTGGVFKVKAYTEYHDEPIGSAPESNPEAQPPFKTTVYRPINSWRFQ